MEKTDNVDFIIFDVGKMQYAIPIEYIAFIVMAMEQFPSCIPPRMPAYMKCVMRMEQELVPIVDLTQVPGFSTSNHRTAPYPLVLIVSYRNKRIGLLTDRVAIRPAEAETNAAVGTIVRHRLVNSNGTNFIQFDVEKFYNQLEAGQV